MAYTTIDDPEAYFQTVIYNGDGNTGRSVTLPGDTDMQPDMVWIKCRTNNDAHADYDAVRGANKRIGINEADAEATQTEGLQSFTADGFTHGTLNAGNNASRTYVAWNWLANGTGSANTDGDLNSTVSVNTTSKFSICSYTGNGTSGATVGHGLGVTPSVVLIKGRSVTDDWLMYHQVNGATKGLATNNGNAVAVSTGYFNDTAPTANVFSLGNNGKCNTNGGTFIAYCFADVAGYFKAGSFTGNGSTDGTFVYTGFRPTFVIGKKNNGTEDWFIFDNKRDPYNVNYHLLYGNVNNAEYTSASDRNDFLSNGFKMRTTGSNVNSAVTYVYAAFGQPIISNGGVCATAR